MEGAAQYLMSTLQNKYFEIPGLTEGGEEIYMH